MLNEDDLPIERVIEGEYELVPCLLGLACGTQLGLVSKRSAMSHSRRNALNDWSLPGLSSRLQESASKPLTQSVVVIA